VEIIAPSEDCRNGSGHDNIRAHPNVRFFKIRSMKLPIRCRRCQSAMCPISAVEIGFAASRNQNSQTITLEVVVAPNVSRRGKPCRCPKADMSANKL
jgi:hypothetical protein